MIPFYRESIPYLSTDQMREVDRLMIDVYHIELIQMMENAGRNLAVLARERFLDGNPQHKQIIILAGTGGNGGGALVCARWLHNAGANVQVYLSALYERFTPIPAHQLDILLQMGVSVKQADGVVYDELPDLIIDGLIGYSLNGPVRGTAANLIRIANEIDCSILSLDTPSGLDTSSGAISEPTIRATATMTLALPKEGLRLEAARSLVGELYLANISIPPELYAQPSLGLDVKNIFGVNDIVRLW